MTTDVVKRVNFTKENIYDDPKAILSGLPGFWDGIGMVVPPLWHLLPRRLRRLPPACPAAN